MNSFLLDSDGEKKRKQKKKKQKLSFLFSYVILRYSARRKKQEMANPDDHNGLVIFNPCERAHVYLPTQVPQGFIRCIQNNADYSIVILAPKGERIIENGQREEGSSLFLLYPNSITNFIKITTEQWFIIPGYPVPEKEI